MSVMIVTSLGDMVMDLFTDRCPLTCKNFLKLCKIKYYNGCLFHTVQKDFTAQTGDPTGTGTGGDSIYKFLYGDQARFFGDEIQLDLKHSKTGTVAMASAGENLNASQFYITLRDDLDYLDGKHTVIGEVAEGLETLNRINEAYVDQNNRPFKNIRIKHTYVLDDPFDDPPQLAALIPDASPEGKPKDEVDDDVRLEDDWVPMDEQLGMEELEEVLRGKEAHSRAVVLESIGDIPEAEIKPPDNVLFVCKLNPVTEDEDLHTIFSRFGTVTSAEIIRDFKTGDSLCYAFIEFEDKEACEQAYFKMDNALIDDRRVHVDFSQSVAKLWSQYRRKDQKGKGGGCFKCGSIDHIARDCPGDSANAQRHPYMLKDGNPQHGGGDSSQYEMVFDEDAVENPKRGKRRRDHEAEKVHEKESIRRADSDDLQERDKRKENSHDSHWHRDRSKEYQEDDRHQRGHSPYSGRERGYKTKDGLDSGRKSYNGNHRDRREEARYEKGRDRDRREEARYEKGRDRDRREEARYEKGRGDDASHRESREYRGHEKGLAGDMSRGDRKDEWDSRKRNVDDDRRQYYKDDADRHSNRRDTREDSYSRKIQNDGDTRTGRREDRDSGKRSTKRDDTRERERDRDRDRGRRH